MKGIITHIFLLIGFQLLGQPILEVGTSSQVGMSEKRMALMDDLINKYVENDWLPGGVFAVARHGKLVYHKSFGARSVDGNNYKNDDLFRIASMTKAVTTVGIMQLYERGLLGLDDPIYQYLPAYKDMEVLDSFNEADSTYTTKPAEKNITIRHLLTHTSGITYGTFNPGKIQIIYEKFGLNAMGLSHPTWTTEEAVNNLAKAPLVFQPGEKYLYGLNMEVLGRIIEVVSAQSLDVYFQEHIFEPLGMNDTHFYLPSGKYTRLVPIYSVDPDGKWITLPTENQLGDMNYPTTAGRLHFAGGGGLSSTALDYAKFIQVLCQGGDHQNIHLLSRKTLEVMTSDQLTVQNAQGTGISKLPGITYCLGFMLLTEAGAGWNAKSPGTYEWGGYFNTKFFIDPKEQLTFVGMTQVLSFKRQEFWDRLYTLIYASIDD